MEKIVVTGATGQLGSIEVLSKLFTIEWFFG
jgi:hypothetical protein